MFGVAAAYGVGRAIRHHQRVHQNVTAWTNMGGWTQGRICDDKTPAGYVPTGDTRWDLCSTLQAATLRPFSQPVEPSWNCIVIYGPANANGRFNYHTTFKRPRVGNPFTIPPQPVARPASTWDLRPGYGTPVQPVPNFADPQTALQRLVETYPGLDPLTAIPIKAPAVPGLPLPYRLLPRIRTNPGRSPTEQPARYNKPVRPSPQPEFAPELGRPDLQADPPPWKMEATAPLPGRPGSPPRGGARPPVTTGTASPRPARPEKGQRERKVYAKGKGALRAILNATNAVSEVNDFVDSLYNALPKHLRRANVRPQWKMKIIWDNWREIDVPQALKNLVENQVEDAFYGKLGQLSGKASKHLGGRGELGIGYQTGPADTVVVEHSP